MPDELNSELDGVENDDPNALDDTTPKPAPASAEEMDDVTLAAALKAGTQSPPVSEQPSDPPKPVDTHPLDPPAKADPPAIDIEAELEKRLQAKLAEVEQRHQQEKQRAIDAVVAKERKRDESAVRKLRDLQAATGMDVDKLLETNRARQIEHLQVEQGLTEQAARELVAAKEKAALYEARETERRREFEEGIKTNEYRNQKLDFIADAKQPDIYKRAMQRYGDEVDVFANHGRPHEDGRAISFDVALKFIAGQHLPEIVAELNAEAEAKLAAKNAEIETRTKAAEQAAIRNIQQRGKAAPETGTGGVAPPEASLTPMEMATAKAFGMTPSQYAKAKANLRPKS